MKNMEKILKQLSLVIVLAYFHLKTGHSKLIVFPHDTEVLVNHSTYLNCSTSILNEQIHWYHYLVGENQTIYVYYKGQFNKIYADRYSIAIDTVKGEYNLIIRSVQPVDAGRYACQDDGGLGGLSSAELIVLDSTPICQSSMKPEGLVGPNSCGLPIDELHLSCSVSYSGNIPPTLQWKMEGDDVPISKGITIDYAVKRVALNLMMSSGVEMDRALYTCSNTRSHDQQYSCRTGPVKIDYAIAQPNTLNITKGDTVMCLANATVSCTYRWFYGNDTLCPASCHQVLSTTRLGDYSCEASCPMSGLSCTFVAIRIFVFENETSIASEDTTKTLLIAILIPAVAILLIITCVLFFIIRKAMSANKVLKDENVILHHTIMLSRGPVHQSTRSADEDENEITRSTANEVRNEVSVPNENPSVENEVEMQPLLTGQMKQLNIHEVKNEVSRPNEDTSVGNEVEMQPLPTGDTNIIQPCIEEEEIKTKASKKMNGAIAGVAVLENLIYVANVKSSEVKMFDIGTVQIKHRCKLKKLKNPWDLTSCKRNKCLYIMDLCSATKPKHIIRFDSDVKVLDKWSTGEDYGTLSVSSEGNVVVTVCDTNRLLIYEPNGIKLNVISLSEDAIHPSHALKLNDGQFLISHGLENDNLHRVIILSANGEIMKNSTERMETPSYLAVDENGLVFVADHGNSRVCVLNSDLEVASNINGLRSPQRLFFYGGNRKLFVADNEVSKFKGRNGKLLSFNC